ncbi:MAG: DUF3316 domain-containing protein [Bacteroides sp.]|nr:DUF3316 domain-containing protein [Bacteroides sp.]MCM1379974.1 DUF3316 domain-containing protein [Bacteroides sp.]MCM1446271.1 DUF3316 domain-containing protein [Prevotella sp.]
MKGLLSALVIILCCAAGLAAEPLRPVSSAWMADFGSAHLADTYLSPQRYSGLHYGLTYSRLQAMKRTQIVQGWDLGIAFDQTKMLGLTLNGGWRMMRRWSLPEGFQLGIGGYAGLSAGVLYMSKNGNNPAQALGSVTIGPEGFAQWSGKIKKQPLAVRWQLSSPLIGAFFCPDYGELYYEIALGNRSDLIHVAWPGSYRRIKSLLSIDLNFGKHTLRLGYRFDATSSRANNIVSRQISHAAVIGIVCDFININSRTNEADIVTAYY